MVNAEAAGVAFSQHPLSGEATVLIEAAFGLGETVVSGVGGVDCYAVHRQTWAETAPPTIAHKRQKRVMAAQGGVKSIEVPAEKRDARVLTPQEAQQVARTALALEQHLGCPQDMEWAFAEGQLYVLQSRPITTQARSYFTDVLPGDNHTWTSGFLNERFPLPVSPLGWSVMRELLEELAFRDPLRYLGLRHVEELRITKLYRGHPYVNLFVFQTLYKVFPGSLLPEDAYRYFPDGKTELRHQAPYPRSLFDPRFLLSMIRHFLREPRVWSPWHNHLAWADFVLRHEAGSQELGSEWRALCKGEAPMQRIWAAIEKAQRLNHELLALHRWSLTHADLTYTLLRRLVGAAVKADDAAELCTRLVTGLPNKSLEVDRALHHLAQTTDPVVFAEAFDAFLARCGHRSFHLDIYYPTFADEPAQVLELVKHLREAAETVTAEGTHEQSGTAEVVTTQSGQGLPGTTEAVTTRSAQDQPGTTKVVTTGSGQMEEARRRVHELCGSVLPGRLQRWLFEHVLYLAQQYMPLREDQRYFWQKTLALMRRLFLLLGQNMAEADLLKRREDVFFLTKSEIEAYVRGQVSGGGYAALADTRQQQFTRLRQEFDVAPGRPEYPPFLQGNRLLQIAEHDRQSQWTGQAVSPGLARGRVAVLFSPAEFDRVKVGDILVTRSVDPGWTPIFALLGALVIEHGGQLSHGAVVAREYGLPAVAGIPGITQLLHDGDVVIVDGLHGVVAKIEEE